jgi:hypothetical protein
VSVDHIAALAAVFLIFGTTAKADVLEIPLEFETSADADGMAPYGSSFTELLDEKPAGIEALPDLLSEKPRFGVFKLGESEFSYVLDASDGEAEHYDTVYLDGNGNGDLTDDPVLKGTIQEFEQGFWYAIFEGTVSLEYELEGERLPYEVGVSISGTDVSRFLENLPEGADIDAFDVAGMSVNCSFSTGCYYSCSLELGDEECRVMLGDSDCDGRFGETAFIDGRFGMGENSPLYASGDQLYLTAEEEFSYHDMAVMGDLLIVGELVFGIEVDIAGRRLLLTPVDEGLFPLELSDDPQRLVIHSRGFERTIMAFMPGPEISVPAGEYQLLNYTVYRSGENEDRWRLSANATRKSPFVTVAGDEAVSLEFGEPFVASVGLPFWFADVDEWSGQENIQLQFAVRGVGNEEVSDLALVSGAESSCEMSTEDEQRPLEPTYTILETDGKQVEKGSFEYG